MDRKLTGPGRAGPLPDNQLAGSLAVIRARVMELQRRTAAEERAAQREALRLADAKLKANCIMILADLRVLQKRGVI